jgi:hypothetical protein
MKISEFFMNEFMFRDRGQRTLSIYIFLVVGSSDAAAVPVLADFRHQHKTLITSDGLHFVPMPERAACISGLRRN